MSEERRVDRAAWAALVAQWRKNIAGGNATRLAKILDVSSKTIGRWINQEVDVSEESVRSAARAMGLKPMDLLIRVGYYAPEEVAAARVAAPADDEESQDEFDIEISYVLQDNTLLPGEKEALVLFIRDLRHRQIVEQEALKRQQRDERRATVQGIAATFRRTRPAAQE